MVYDMQNTCKKFFCTLIQNSLHKLKKKRNILKVYMNFILNNQ